MERGHQVPHFASHTMPEIAEIAPFIDLFSQNEAEFPLMEVMQPHDRWGTERDVYDVATGLFSCCYDLIDLYG